MFLVIYLPISILTERVFPCFQPIVLRVCLLTYIVPIWGVSSTSSSFSVKRMVFFVSRSYSNERVIALFFAIVVCSCLYPARSLSYTTPPTMQADAICLMSVYTRIVELVYVYITDIVAVVVVLITKFLSAVLCFIRFIKDVDRVVL